MRKISTYTAFCLLIALAATVFAEDVNTEDVNAIAKPQVVATEDIAVTVNGEPIKQTFAARYRCPIQRIYCRTAIAPHIRESLSMAFR